MGITYDFQHSILYFLITPLATNLPKNEFSPFRLPFSRISLYLSLGNFIDNSECHDQEQWVVLSQHYHSH